MKPQIKYIGDAWKYHLPSVRDELGMPVIIKLTTRPANASAYVKLNSKTNLLSIEAGSASELAGAIQINFRLEAYN